MVVPALVGVAFLVLVLWPNRDSPTTVLSPDEVAALQWRMSPDNPANQPFPGPPEYFSTEQRRAVEAVTTGPSSLAGRLTTVVSVEKTTYNTVMCGRGFTQPEDHEVWLVWLKGPFKFRLPSGLLREEPPEYSDVAFVVHGADFYSEQSFSGWPIARAGGRSCPP